MTTPKGAPTNKYSIANATFDNSIIDQNGISENVRRNLESIRSSTVNDG